MNTKTLEDLKKSQETRAEKALEYAIEYVIESLFPNIKGLVVTTANNELVILFEVGEYSKEEVEVKVQEFIKEHKNPIDLDKYIISESEFGVTVKPKD
jgi:hypothetical protein